MTDSPLSPIVVLFALEDALAACGPDAKAAARAVSQLMPDTVDREAVYLDLLAAPGPEIGPGPWEEKEVCFFVTVAWRALPERVRGVAAVLQRDPRLVRPS